MDAKLYLQSYGWKDGEALQLGGIRKPILVKHKKDTKGLGHGTNEADMWWELLFDGQLKNLEVTHNKKGGVSISHNVDAAVETARKANLPLYRMFVKGKGLAGTVGKKDSTLVKAQEMDSTKVFELIKMGFEEKSVVEKIKPKKEKREGKEKGLKADKKDKVSKKERKKTEKKTKKEKKEGREKKDKKDKKDKKEKKEKKDKKDKKERKEKKDKKDKTKNRE